MYFIQGGAKVTCLWCQVMFAPPCRSCYPYITVTTVVNYEANDFGELLNVVTGGEEDLCSLLKFVKITIKTNQKIRCGKIRTGMLLHSFHVYVVPGLTLRILIFEGLNCWGVRFQTTFVLHILYAVITQNYVTEVVLLQFSIRVPLFWIMQLQKEIS